MIDEILVLAAFLVENCTGVVLLETQVNDGIQPSDSETTLLTTENSPNPIQNLASVDQQYLIFQEFDPPKHLEDDPHAWKKRLPTFKKSFWVCLRAVLLIQAVAGTFIGLVGVAIVISKYITDYCDYEDWDKTPKDMQRLRVTGTCIEGLIYQTFDFFFLWTLFPPSVIKKLHLLTFSLLAAVIDVSYKLFLQLFDQFTASWSHIPIDTFFCLVIAINHFRVARHFHPRSLKDTKALFAIISAQVFLGIPVAFFVSYRLLPLYMEQKRSIKIIIATVSPLLTALPKVVCRLGAQNENGNIDPGSAYVLVANMYGLFAVVFRVMQAELTNISLFIVLGVAHALIDLLERITITMRDHIWEYLYRLVRRQRSRQPKYRSPRSRRFIADVSIQIMMQEATAMIIALGFFAAYRLLYSTPKPFKNYNVIYDFAVRAMIGLSIDLVFNVISLLIQTRVMNIAVNRVWNKKWRHHMIVNSLTLCVSILFFGGHLIFVVIDKYDETFVHANTTLRNCTFPNFL